MIYLDFEKPIEELADKLTKAKELADKIGRASCRERV